ncbi:MAG: hypothetical protein MI717_12500 [Spirochaetales bacterium]|nr:hypothetical protein [Spirochaetales bacterium]
MKTKAVDAWQIAQKMKKGRVSPALKRLSRRISPHPLATGICLGLGPKPSKKLAQEASQVYFRGKTSYEWETMARDSDFCFRRLGRLYLMLHSHKTQQLPLLFQGLEDSDPILRLDTLRFLSSQEERERLYTKLSRILRHDPNPQVRRAAGKRIKGDFADMYALHPASLPPLDCLLVMEGLDPTHPDQRGLMEEWMTWDQSFEEKEVAFRSARRLGVKGTHIVDGENEHSTENGEEHPSPSPDQSALAQLAADLVPPEEMLSFLTEDSAQEALRLFPLPESAEMSPKLFFLAAQYHWEGWQERLQLALQASDLEIRQAALQALKLWGMDDLTPIIPLLWDDDLMQQALPILASTANHSGDEPILYAITQALEWGEQVRLRPWAKAMGKHRNRFLFSAVQNSPEALPHLLPLAQEKEAVLALLDELLKKEEKLGEKITLLGGPSWWGTLLLYCPKNTRLRQRVLAWVKTAMNANQQKEPPARAGGRSIRLSKKEKRFLAMEELSES